MSTRENIRLIARASYHVFVMIIYFLANNEDPDEIMPYAAFHLGLPCFPSYLYMGIKYKKTGTKGINIANNQQQLW